MIAGISSVLTDHFGLFAFYAAVAVAVLMAAWLPGLKKAREGGSGGRKAIVGWALVLVVPTALYLAALAGKFSV
jgi:hypothetical protein